MTSGRDFGLGFLAGVLATALVSILVGLALFRRTERYGLGHWKLNIKTPIRSMWLNVGYWADSEGKAIDDFPTASAALLREVITTAGLTKHLPQNRIAILDLGFGCGDQTWDLVQTLHSTRSEFNYVGLTLDNDQVRSAQRRLCREIAAHPSMDDLTLHKVGLYCADAGKPETWNQNITRAVESLSDKTFSERWLLALDCLYYFKPSRGPVFQYATGKLHANLAVFDMVLSDAASKRDVLLAKAIGVIMGCPRSTFMTETEYRHQLIHCGYDGETIIVRDVTKHVFLGLVAFLDRQDASLAELGVSLGGFKLAQRLFAWFAKSRVLRAVIVVAHVK